ncbi:cytosine deaminase [Pelagicoccus albus]|uniref:Cytosine deaminase n=1 Tax=Pelagicoccus albus TaxID=415222 RepID=A0A7X1BBA8_9BACT|nr:cytosine deaminase [Pelagicoccus albus]MBC2607873.1 cytosine deaminase [Pelagicoccus albus]
MTLDDQPNATLIAKAPRCLLPEKLELREDAEGLSVVKIVLEGDTVKSISQHDEKPEEGCLDVSDQLLFPGFLDAHTHLDKAHSWERAPNRSGTFDEALKNLFKDKVHWTEEDVYARANYSLECAYAYGTVALRTHVDTGLDWAERSYKALSQLREDWKGKVDLQMVSLCRVDDYATDKGEALADLPIRYGANALGGMPLMNPELDSQLDRLLGFAKERGVGLDLHVDESGNPDADCLSAVARAVIRNEFTNTVVCGHCCSLAVRPIEKQKETLELVKEAGLKIVSLPMCNLYLQDRRGVGDTIQTPYWRGITLAHEFMERGVPFACASDNVRDAFYAFGDFDMLEVYRESVRIGHLDRRLQESTTVVTSQAASLMDLGEKGFGRIAPGAPARFVKFAASSLSQLLSRPRIDRQLFLEGSFKSLEIPPYRKLV